MKERIAIQGFDGSFHQLAGLQYFGRDTNFICCSSFREVIHAIKEDTGCTGGVMAIENSIAGSILPNYNLIARADLHIVGEVFLHIDQNLLVNPGVTLEDIREVHSHPMALLQCTDYLEKFPWKIVETEDTALSAAEVRDTRSRHIAAIAGRFAAEMFGLEVLGPDIQSANYNYTRFWILRKEDVLLRQADKASLVFQTDHSKGSLARVLTRIAECGVNLSKLQSYPIPGSDWKYQFHADCEFVDRNQWEKLVEAIKPITAGIQIYGMYKNGKIDSKTENENELTTAHIN